MADWSSLPTDLINRVADCFLATNDLDYYMDLRAVCPNWRSSTTDPKTSPDEPRFRPRCWVMLDEEDPKFSRRDDTRLFLNAATGRFLRKDLPILRRYYLVTTTSGGFIVLVDREPPHAARVLNPFTGSLVRFMASVPPLNNLVAAVVGSVNSFTLVLASDYACKVYWADPENEAFLFEHKQRPSAVLPYVAARYAGRKNGMVLTDTDEAKQTLDLRRSCQLEFRTFAAAGSVGGEILLASLEQGSHAICVGTCTDQGVMEQVTSIGSRALFLGDRCLLVDADKLPSIDANCVYYQVHSPDALFGAIYRYDLSQGKAERIAGAFIANPNFRGDDHPPTLIQLLVSYTMDMPRNELLWASIPDDIDCLGYLDFDYDDLFDD